MTNSTVGRFCGIYDWQVAFGVSGGRKFAFSASDPRQYGNATPHRRRGETGKKDWPD